MNQSGRYIVLLYLGGLFCCNAAFASGAGDTTAVKTESKLPAVGLGYGAMTFIGDVGNSYINTPFFYRGAFQLDVQLHTRSNVEIFFHILTGKIFGEEKSLNRNVNFMSNISAEGANIRYS